MEARSRGFVLAMLPDPFVNDGNLVAPCLLHLWQLKIPQLGPQPSSYKPWQPLPWWKMGPGTFPGLLLLQMSLGWLVQVISRFVIVLPSRVRKIQILGVLSQFFLGRPNLKVLKHVIVHT